MAYGFDTNKNKVDVIAKGDVVSFTVSATVSAESASIISLSLNDLIAYGFEGNSVAYLMNHYVLLNAYRKYISSHGTQCFTDYDATSGKIYPYIYWETDLGNLIINVFNPYNSQQTIEVTLAFLKV